MSQPGETGAPTAGQTSVTPRSGSTPATDALITLLSTTSPRPTGTTTKQCEEMEAVDEAVSKKIEVTPRDLPKGQNVDFQPTSDKGVSFPEDQKKPTIVVKFDKPADVQSVTLPRDKTPGARGAFRYHAISSSHVAFADELCSPGMHMTDTQWYDSHGDSRARGFDASFAAHCRFQTPRVLLAGAMANGVTEYAG